MPKATIDSRPPAKRSDRPTAGRRKVPSPKLRAKRAATNSPDLPSAAPLQFNNSAMSAADTAPSIGSLMMTIDTDEVRRIHEGYMQLANLNDLSESEREEAIYAQKLLVQRESAVVELLLSQPALTPDEALTQIDYIVLPMDCLAGEGDTSSHARGLGEQATRLFTAAAVIIARSSGLDLGRYTYSNLKKERFRLFPTAEDGEKLARLTPGEVLADLALLHPKLHALIDDPGVPDVHYLDLEDAGRVLASVASVLCDLAGLRLDQFGKPTLGDIYAREFPLASRDFSYCMSLGAETSAE